MSKCNKSLVISSEMQIPASQHRRTKSECLQKGPRNLNSTNSPGDFLVY